MPALRIERRTERSATRHRVESVKYLVRSKEGATVPDTCATCGTKLGFARRLTGATTCSGCATKSKSERQAAEAEYRSTVERAADPTTDLALVATALPSLAQRSGMKPEQARDLSWRSLLAAFERALIDEVVTKDEEARLERLASALGLTEYDVDKAIQQYRAPLFIAQVNDGRLPEFYTTRIMLKKNEVAHLESAAALLKEVQIKEYRGGSHGVSFRIARGVSYRVGASRGRMHVVGTELQTQDEGTLTVTSHRAVFAGTRKTVEISFAKLLGLNVFNDGIQFHVSNRQIPSFFRVESGPMVAAAVNGATQRLDL